MPAERQRLANTQLTRPTPQLVPSIQPGLPPTIAFIDPESSADVATQPCKSKHLIVYFHGVANSAIRQCFYEAGFRCTQKREVALIHWGLPPKPEEYAAFRPYQRCNHFPGTWELGRKDNLYRCTARQANTSSACLQSSHTGWQRKLLSTQFPHSHQCARAEARARTLLQSTDARHTQHSDAGTWRA